MKYEFDQGTPEAIQRAVSRICGAYGIQGTCDPMYIANVVATELGLGDGKGSFRVQQDDAYNGWPNRETWATFRHITNDQELYNYFDDFVSEVRACRFDFPTQAIADKCRDWFESQRDLMIDGSCHRDTAAALTDIGSLWRVDWDAIAKALAED